MNDFDNTGKEVTYTEIVLKPHLLQFLIMNIGWLSLMIAIATLLCVIDVQYNTLLQIANGILALMCLSKALTLFSIKYIITNEQIIYIHGVINRETNFIELYRVVDYQETRTFLQWVFGLKNVIIFSMDKNIRVLFVIGMKRNCNITAAIRERVEYNKKRKGIYEITNR